MSELRVSERVNRRAARSGGRRVTDQYADVAHGILCDACDLGIAVITASRLDGGALMLTYRCPTCGHIRDVFTRVLAQPRPS
jgi:hypothetical protein